MQKTIVKRTLALTAAAALGLGTAFASVPVSAAEQPVLNQQSAVKAAKQVDVVNAFGFDNGTLHLGVEKASDVKSTDITKLQKKYGADNVVVQSGVKELDAYAANDAVGGMGYLIEATGGTSVCSAGFPGYDGEGKPVVLTAGHCAEEIDEETSEIVGTTQHVDAERPSTAEANGGEGFDPKGTGKLGEWGFKKFGSVVKDGQDTGNEGDIDFAVINVDASKYNVKAAASDWTSADSDDLSTSVKDLKSVGSHTEGKIQKSGRTTGLTEADVIPRESAPFDYMSISGRWVHGFAVEAPLGDPFSAPGDSGGAVFQGDKGVGVISGGGPAEWSDGTQFDLSWVADIDYSLEQSGVDFTLEKEAPKPPEAPVAEDQTIAPKGAVTGTAPADSKVKVSWAPAEGKGQQLLLDAQGAPQGDTEVTADADGNFTIEGPDAAGTYAYTATTVGGEAGDSDPTNFTVTVEEENAANADDNSNGAADGSDDNADGADGSDDNADGADGSDAGANAANGSSDGEETPAERGIVVEPKEILAADFVKKDKGVTITASGFEEGENVTLEVVAGPENVKGVELKQVANKDGVASFSVYGTNASSPSVYLGKYDVKVTGADDTADEKALAGSFEVVNDKGGNGGGNGGGSDLPRTGAELTGLAAGAGLLLVGGAAVVLTMRRNSKKN